MSYREWLELLSSAEKASIISGRCRKIHYKFPRGGQEMIEEYSLDTGVLLRRAWKRKKELRGDTGWEIELGDSIPDVARGDDGGFIMKESNSEVKIEIPECCVKFLIDDPFQPFITKRSTRQSLEWRIRNLPYPLDNYDVTVNKTDKAIVVRTKNKKYFKNIKIQELERCNEDPEQKSLTIAHQHNTLIITVGFRVEESEEMVLIYSPISSTKSHTSSWRWKRQCWSCCRMSRLHLTWTT